jgi:hypothetical protein
MDDLAGPVTPCSGPARGKSSRGLCEVVRGPNARGRCRRRRRRSLHASSSRRYQRHLRADRRRHRRSRCHRRHRRSADRCRCPLRVSSPTSPVIVSFPSPPKILSSPGAALDGRGGNDIICGVSHPGWKRRPGSSSRHDCRSRRNRPTPSRWPTPIRRRRVRADTSQTELAPADIGVAALIAGRWLD